MYLYCVELSIRVMPIKLNLSTGHVVGSDVFYFDFSLLDTSII